MSNWLKKRPEHRNYPQPFDLPPIPKNLRDLEAALEQRGFKVTSALDLDLPASRRALDAFIASVSTSLKAGKEVRLVGFGSFVPIKRPAGTARNPRTGETVRRKASATCKFKVGEALKSQLNGSALR